MSNASIAARAARIFPARACMDGFPLFTTERVALTHVTPRAVLATVKSQHVEIETKGEGLAIACTCSPGAIAACKHVWATLLAVDRAGALEGLRAGIRPISVEHKPPKEPEKKRGTGRSTKRNAKKA
jgi:hypothetical protein